MIEEYQLGIYTQDEILYLRQQLIEGEEQMLHQRT